MEFKMEFKEAEELVDQLKNTVESIELAISRADTQKWVKVYLKDNARAMLHSLIATKG